MKTKILCKLSVLLIIASFVPVSRVSAAIHTVSVTFARASGSGNVNVLGIQPTGLTNFNSIPYNARIVKASIGIGFGGDSANVIEYNDRVYVFVGTGNTDYLPLVGSLQRLSVSAAPSCEITNVLPAAVKFLNGDRSVATLTVRTVPYHNRTLMAKTANLIITYEIDDSYPVIASANSVNAYNSSTGAVETVTPSAVIVGKNGQTMRCWLYKVTNGVKATNPLQTKNVAMTGEAQTVSFTAISASNLSGSGVELSLEVSFNDKLSAKNIPFDLSNKNLAVSAVNVYDFANGLYIVPQTVNAGGKDIKYKYTVNGAASEYLPQNYFIKTGLSPNSQYTIRVDIQDVGGNTAYQEISGYTKALIPDFGIEKVSNSVQKIILETENPDDTEYCVQIKDGERVGYLNGDGSVTWDGAAVWIVFSDKETETQIQNNSAYKIRIKARNVENAETLYGKEAVSY
jgi:hypothetical protein